MATIPHPRTPIYDGLLTATCPAWCVRPSGHDLTDPDPDDGAVRRVHIGPERRVAGHIVQADALETVHPDGTVTTDGPVAVWAVRDRPDGPLTPDEARALAAALDDATAPVGGAR